MKHYEMESQDEGKVSEIIGVYIFCHVDSRGPPLTSLLHDTHQISALEANSRVGADP